jgi:hypothetical protein
MLNPLKCMFEDYCHLLMKMAIDSTIVALATSKLDWLYDVQVMFNLPYLLPMLIVVHSFIKFAQIHDIFMCDFIVTISFCKTNLF